MPLDELSIIIDVVDSFSDEINELLGDLETVDLQAGKVDDIWIDVDVLGDEEIATLQAELASLTDEQLIVDADVRGEGKLLNFAALKEAVASDEISNINFRETGLDQIIGKTAIATSEVMALKALAGDIDFGRMGRVGGPARGDGPEEGLLNFSMADLHNILAKIIPLLLVFVGALPAVIGGLLGLATAAVSAAAALGALGALGAYGFALQAGDGDLMKGLREIVKQVREDFNDAFAPLARDLAPLFEDALEGFGDTFDALASYGDILRNLTDDARAFGRFMQRYIVGTAASMGRLAEQAGPLFGFLATVVEDLNLIEGMTGFLAETLPSLVAFGSALADIVIKLSNMSVGFLQVATMAIEMMNIMLGLIETIDIFDGALTRGIAGALALTTALSILNSTALANTIKSIYSAVESFYAMAVSEGLASAVTSGLTLSLQTLKAMLWKTAITAAIVTGGLYAVGIAAGFIASQFLSTSGAIDEATKSLEEFQNVKGDLDSGVGGDGSIYQFRPGATGDKTVINAQSVPEGKRVMRKKKFDDYYITQ